MNDKEKENILNFKDNYKRKQLIQDRKGLDLNEPSRLRARSDDNTKKENKRKQTIEINTNSK